MCEYFTISVDTFNLGTFPNKVVFIHTEDSILIFFFDRTCLGRCHFSSLLMKPCLDHVFRNYKQELACRLFPRKGCVYHGFIPPIRV